MQEGRVTTRETPQDCHLLVSVVIPIYNEAKSIRALVDRLIPVLHPLGPHEVILVDDGSTDGSSFILDEVQKENPSIVKILYHRTNRGKATALQNGFRKASGELIVMMDGDLQDQPEEIPKLLAALDERYLDAVTGWKINRKDPFSKTFPSLLFNRILNRVSGLEIHDFNCGLKAFRKESLRHVNLHGQMHRFILIFLAQLGFKVGEVPVEHAPRAHGKSKYGVRRLYHGFMDFLTVFFITRYLESPLHFFGLYGACVIAVSIPTGLYFVLLHFYSLMAHYPAGHLSEHPLWVLSPILFVIGLIMIFFGLLGELITHHLLSSQSVESFIKSQVGFDSEKEPVER